MLTATILPYFEGDKRKFDIKIEGTTEEDREFIDGIFENTKISVVSLGRSGDQRGTSYMCLNFAPRQE